MLKTAKYRIGGLEDFGEVVYAIFNKKRIVFSGITKPGSTINYAEDIIRNIAAIEGIGPLIYQWFDLQTHLGYHSREPGVFSFSKLVGTHEAGTPLHVEKWEALSIPSVVFTLFQECIGGPNDTAKLYTPEEARTSGYTPTDKHSTDMGRCFILVGLHQSGRELAASLELRGIA